jgi:hypothetical protein
MLYTIILCWRDIANSSLDQLLLKEKKKKYNGGLAI